MPKFAKVKTHWLQIEQAKASKYAVDGSSMHQVGMLFYSMTMA